MNYQKGNIYCQMSTDNFSEWLREELTKREWSQADLARRSGVSPSQLTRIFSGERGIGQNSLVSIARALKISPVTVLRKAGLLPTVANGDADVHFEDWEFLLKQLPPEDQEELRQIAEMKLERRRKDGSLKSLRTKKAG